LKAILSYIKSRQGSFLIAADIMMLLGVSFFGWSILRVISFFWLDTLVMLFFLLLLLTRDFGMNFLAAIPLYLVAASALTALYFNIYQTCFEAGLQPDKDDYMCAFRPLYETAGILISIICGHFFECRFFMRIMKTQPEYARYYFYIFFARFFLLGIVMFVFSYVVELFLTRYSVIIPIVILVVLKEIMEYNVYKIYQAKQTLEEENEITMI